MKNLDFVDFGLALAHLRTGKKVSRKGWNGKKMFIFLVDGSTFNVNRAPLNKFYPEGKQINYRSHIDMRTIDDEIVPWVASQTDLLAYDWQVVE